VGIEDEADIEIAVFDFGMVRFGLGHNKSMVLFGDFAQFLGLFTRNVDYERGIWVKTEL
jgi:hypothetical protein